MMRCCVPRSFALVPPVHMVIAVNPREASNTQQEGRGGKADHDCGHTSALRNRSVSMRAGTPCSRMGGKVALHATDPKMKRLTA